MTKGSVGCCTTIFARKKKKEYILKGTRKMNSLLGPYKVDIRDFIKRYRRKIFCISDLNLDGRPLIINGKEVDIRTFFRKTFYIIRSCTLLLILGDMFEDKTPFSEEIIDKQRNIFYEELDRQNLLGKTIFIIGNGGSIATASHLAEDLMLQTDRKVKVDRKSVV